MIFCFVDERFYFTDGESKEILEACEIQFKESSLLVAFGKTSNSAPPSRVTLLGCPRDLKSGNRN